LIGDLGFKDVYVLLGGFGAWQQAGLPVEPSTP
jgi:3-mercaptopyruvate sulfurtransferase SseA